MTSQESLRVDQSTQPEATSVKQETQAQRFQRLKQTADATGDTSFMSISKMNESGREINADLPHALFRSPVRLPSVPLSKRLTLSLIY